MEWIESISKAIEYMETHITENLTVNDIAKEVCISPFYFQKGFSMLCGFTVAEYIRQRRLTLAAIELVSTDNRIIDIAMKYGYDIDKACELLSKNNKMIHRIALQKHSPVFMAPHQRQFVGMVQ